MHKNATKCNETLSKWCKNKYGGSKIIDTFETYQSQIAQLEDGDKYVSDIFEKADEQLNCKFLGAPSIFMLKKMLTCLLLMQALA
jgi:hypothetical protein